MSAVRNKTQYRFRTPFQSKSLLKNSQISTVFLLGKWGLLQSGLLQVISHVGGTGDKSGKLVFFAWHFFRDLFIFWF